MLSVVVTVLVIARSDGVRVPGSGVGAGTRGVPASGDCVAAFTESTPSMPPLIFGSAAAVVGDRSVVFSGCTATHVGEVIAFRRIAPGSGDAAGSDAQWCTQIGAGYGEHARWQANANATGPWTPAGAQRFMAIESGADADATAHRWAACAVMAPGLERYEGSFVRSLADSAPPAPFGFCRTGEQPDHRVSCETPHREQVFAFAVTGGDQRPGSCPVLVRQAMATSDVTGGGRLEVGVTPEGSVVTCSVRVVGPERLTGTLLGIGDNPLPLSG